MNRLLASLSIAALAAAMNPAFAAVFDDVSGSYRYIDAIEYVEDEGYVDGYPDGTFRPNSTINRAEFVKILINARFSQSTIANCLNNVGISPWKDTMLTDWFAPYLCVAKRNGIIDGYPDGTFRAANAVNAAEASKIVVNAYGYRVTPVQSNENWYTPFVNKAFELGAFPPTVTNVAAPITRGEMAEMVYRMDIAAGKADGPGSSSRSSSSKSTINTGTREEDTDIEYGENARHTLDVFWKSNFDNAPIAVLVHGGGWWQGKKSSLHNLAKLLRDEGYVVVTPNYRLTSDGKTEFPDPIQDVACAVGWIREHADDYGANENTILIGGESAGGHITAMLAYDHERNWIDDSCDTPMETRYDAFLGIVGVYDFDTVPNAESKAQGDAFLGDLASPSKWGVAEPINYVGGGDPPGFILGGENDTLIGTQNAILFHDKLRDAGINATLIVAPGYGHNARVYLMNNEDIQRQLFDFLDDEMPQ